MESEEYQIIENKKIDGARKGESKSSKTFIHNNFNYAHPKWIARIVPLCVLHDYVVSMKEKMLFLNLCVAYITITLHACTVLERKPFVR